MRPGKRGVDEKGAAEAAPRRKYVERRVYVDDSGHPAAHERHTGQAEAQQTQCARFRDRLTDRFAEGGGQHG